MTERFPQQRNRSAQRRADADRVRAVTENTASENAAFDDDDAVFDDSFVAAAAVREPSAEDRALQRQLLPDQRTTEPSLPLPAARWSVRPSHHFTAIRPLPVAAAVLCVFAVVTLLVILLR